MKRFRYGEKGFTLIELLVVIAILGILAAIVVPNFIKFLGTGSNEAACIELRMVQTAAIAYAADNNGNFTTDIGDLDEYFVGGPILGTYILDGTTGEVTQSDYPGTDAGCPDQ